MNRTPAVILAAIALAVAALCVPVALAQATISYVVPGPDHTLIERSTTFGPGVVAAVLAILVACAALGWLIFVILRRSTRVQWIVVLGVIVVDIAVVLAVLGLDRPKF
jgi:ascorbate-specific PTS system EIIC-type component UlaA